MSHPWDPDTSDKQQYSHDTYEDDGIIKCRRCGKMATAEGKLKRTPCNPERKS